MEVNARRLEVQMLKVNASEVCVLDLQDLQHLDGMSLQVGSEKPQ